MSSVQQQVLTALELISSQQSDMGKLLIVLSREQERTSKGLTSNTEALLKMSQQQAEQAVLVKNLCSHQDNTSSQLLNLQGLMTEILKELQKPPVNTNTLELLKELLEPLATALRELSRKLPEPPAELKPA